MPQDATTKLSTIINFEFVHVIKKNSRCINLNTLMYLKYNFF